MIYTITFNPSLDYDIYMGDFKPGGVNRAEREKISIGGKGINCSEILSVLGLRSVALGFIAGFVGREIESGVKAADRFDCDFIALDEGVSRINFNIIADSETKINLSGPAIESRHIDRLFAKLKLLKKGDVLMLAGSVPPFLPTTIYADILSSISDDVITVVDAQGELLTNSLKHKPFLIKPNLDELRGIFDNAVIDDRDSVVKYARRLQEFGALNVLVSLGGDGAVLLNHDGGIFESKPPVGNVFSTVGAGDAMPAGFTAGWLNSENYEYALKTGTAAGTARVFCEGVLTASDIEGLVKNIEVKEVCK